MHVWGYGGRGVEKHSQINSQGNSLYQSEVFQYKILNNILNWNARLFKMHMVDSGLCSLCNSEEESVLHFFWNVESHQHYGIRCNHGPLE